MDYVLLFLSDFILGYLLQVSGYLLGISASVRRKVVFPEFAVLALIYALIGFGIRQISIISFGFHTVLNMVAFVAIAIGWMKTPLLPTVIGVLISSAAVLLSEVLNIGLLSVFMGYDKVMTILAGDGTVLGAVNKAVAGLPTNIFLILLMYIFYRVRMKPKKEIASDGKACAPAGAEDRERGQR